MPNSTSETTTRCPKCQSTNLVTKTGCSETPRYYAKEVCGDCGRHIRWLPDPRPSEAQEERNQQIQRMLASHSLNQWETRFLNSLKGQKYISQTQENKLNEIRQKCLDGNSYSSYNHKKFQPWRGQSWV